jgi:hypothetical protein
VDAYQELHPDALDRMLARFAADPCLDEVFTSYDDRPAAHEVVSRFRNLLNHHHLRSDPASPASKTSNRTAPAR